jgi:hypothetical protein
MFSAVEVAAVARVAVRNRCPLVRGRHVQTEEAVDQTPVRCQSRGPTAEPGAANVSEFVQAGRAWLPRPS